MNAPHEGPRQQKRRMLDLADVGLLLERHRIALQDGKQTYVADDIPAKKLANARAAYASLGDVETPLVLIENSIFGKATGGVVLSDSHLYGKIVGEKGNRIALSEINDIRRSESQMVLVNGREFRYVGLATAASVQVFIRLVESIAGLRDAGDLSVTEAEKAVDPPPQPLFVWARMDGGKLIWGCFLAGVAMWEMSTHYLAENYLVPYQQTNLMRSLFSSALVPLLVGLWGLRAIYAGIKPAVLPDVERTVK